MWLDLANQTGENPDEARSHPRKTIDMAIPPIWACGPEPEGVESRGDRRVCFRNLRSALKAWPLSAASPAEETDDRQQDDGSQERYQHGGNGDGLIDGSDMEYGAQ